MRFPAGIGVVLLVAPALARPAACAAESAMLAGLLPSTEDVQARWPWSDAWVFPVGDSLEFGRACENEPSYKINRGVLRRAADGTEHDGADLANGHAGGRVRAAASGLVVSARSGTNGGYGSNVVIAHRLLDGSMVYTVYAHLLRGSTRVRAGASVSAGQAIARVGQTGRATTPHLHFEVRVAEDSTLRWENCPVEDPVEFVRERLPEARPDSDWAAPYLGWAEFAALVPRGVRAATPLDVEMLSRALDRAGLQQGVLTGNDVSATAGEGGTDALGWNTIARALTDLGTHPRRLPPCPVASKPYARLCTERLGVKRPARELPRLAARTDAPTVGELCLALADFAAREPKFHAPRHPKRHPQ